MRKARVATELDVHASQRRRVESELQEERLESQLLAQRAAEAARHGMAEGEIEARREVVALTQLAHSGREETSMARRVASEEAAPLSCASGGCIAPVAFCIAPCADSGAFPHVLRAAISLEHL